MLQSGKGLGLCKALGSPQIPCLVPSRSRVLSDTADRGGYNMLTYALAILLHI